MLHTPTPTRCCENSSLTTGASITASMLLKRLCHALNPGFFLLTFAILTNAFHERIVSEIASNTKRHYTSPRARRGQAALSSTSQMPIMMLTVRGPFFGQGNLANGSDRALLARTTFPRDNQHIKDGRVMLKQPPGPTGDRYCSNGSSSSILTT